MISCLKNRVNPHAPGLPELPRDSSQIEGMPRNLARIGLLQHLPQNVRRDMRAARSILMEGKRNNRASEKITEALTREYSDAVAEHGQNGANRILASYVTKLKEDQAALSRIRDRAAPQIRRKPRDVETQIKGIKKYFIQNSIAHTKIAALVDNFDEITRTRTHIKNKPDTKKRSNPNNFEMLLHKNAIKLGGLKGDFEKAAYDRRAFEEAKICLGKYSDRAIPVFSEHYVDLYTMRRRTDKTAGGSVFKNGILSAHKAHAKNAVRSEFTKLARAIGLAEAARRFDAIIDRLPTGGTLAEFDDCLKSEIEKSVAPAPQARRPDPKPIPVSRNSVSITVDVDQYSNPLWTPPHSYHDDEEQKTPCGSFSQGAFGAALPASPAEDDEEWLRRLSTDSLDGFVMGGGLKNTLAKMLDDDAAAVDPADDVFDEGFMVTLEEHMAKVAADEKQRGAPAGD